MDISILHLSDLHIIDKNGTYSEILGNLINDIKEQCLHYKHIILVITGDIINKATYTDKNQEIVLSFFSTLKKEIGDKIVGVEITPGNHDKEQHEINKALVNNYRKSENITNINITEWDYFLVSYKKYLNLANRIRRIFNKNSILLTNSYYIEEIDELDFKIIFLNLDTSWSSYGGNADKRNLCIDERQVNDLKEEYQKIKRETSKKYVTIMTAHHPLNWLKEKDETFISPWLFNSEYFNIDFYLCGHTHDRQIKSFFDTYKSYITLVTGIGWDEKTPDEERNKHRYSIYNLNIKNGSCEIIVRKTRSDGLFDYDNDILLTNEEKDDKRIYIPLKPFSIKPKITIPIYQNDKIKNEYLFIDNHILEMIKNISTVFYEVANHMALFQAMHIRDFFVKYELNKTSKGTVTKHTIYDNYFYKNIDNQKVDDLFDNIVNNSIIYYNFISYLRELCGTLISELKDKFEEIEYIRLHFRKYFKTENEHELYVAFCQAILEDISTPPIRDIDYNDSMIKIAFEQNKSFVYNHNKTYNPLPMSNSIYQNFITMAPSINKNIHTYKDNRKDVTRPYLTASLSITCKQKTNILDILNYLNIQEFIFKLVFEYATLFKINMSKFIEAREEPEDAIYKAN